MEKDKTKYIRDIRLIKLLSEDELWELMLFSGYLTVEEKNRS